MQIVIGLRDTQMDVGGKGDLERKGRGTLIITDLKTHVSRVYHLNRKSRHISSP